MKTETKPNITGEEPAVLKELVDSSKLPSKAAIRLLVILNRADGKTLESISDFLSVSLSSVIRYIKRFNSNGLESLLKRPENPGKRWSAWKRRISSVPSPATRSRKMLPIGV
ncbi:MAG: helix-turn-helix domain-containing protein [Spirochaetaceae bacterium]|nr:helix-turn-helix domain-containing protein [Spirochaetaceae bacterium]